MRTFAFVFARGGSKGLPRKNIKPLRGKPLLCYSIELAQQLPEVEQVFVSTEDADIASTAQAAGAIVIERPAELATDTSAEFLAWRHAVDWVEQHYGQFDHFVSLPATAPLRSKEDVQAALLKLQQTGADICVSMTPAQRSPYFNMVRQQPDGLVDIAIKDNGQLIRRQDAPELFDLTTVVYATSPAYIRQSAGVLTGKVTAVIIPKQRAVDIDDIYDFMLAEVLLSATDFNKNQ
jgi:N-acylneuraminate cytidylyltransferase